MKNKGKWLAGLFVMFGIIAGVQAQVTWDADTGAANIQDGDGTWTADSTSFLDGTSVNRNYNLNEFVYIGENNGGVVKDGAWVITIDNNGALLPNITGDMTIRQNYTINGAASGDGVSVNALQIVNGANVVINAVLGGPTSTKNWNNNGTLTLNGGGVLGNLKGNGNLSGPAGLYIISGGSWTNPAGDLAFGSNATNTEVRITGGVVTTQSSLSIGNASTSGSTLTTVAGGTLNIMNNFDIGGAAGNAVFTVSSGTVYVKNNTRISYGSGVGGGSAAININGGAFDGNNVTLGNAVNASYATNAELNINNGVARISNIYFSNNVTGFPAGSTATLRLTNGALWVNTITNQNTDGSLAAKVVLGSGTLGIRSAAGGLTVAAGLNTEFTGNTILVAGQEDGTARNMTFNNVLSGTGGFTKAGGGTLLLNAANTYTGNTTVSSGTLNAAVAQSLGLGGDVSVLNGGILRLGNVASINDLSSLYLVTGAQVNLDFVGTTNIESLFFNSTLIDSLTIGQSYTASQLNTALGTSIFIGGGSLSISAIPEPSTWLLLALGFGILSVSAIRRRHLLKV
ncbi:MAG: autotransporter-associated beta strand repeat-containing protein [Verrucomicrobiales bacterium]|jgi:autotransporter-associated beta strand protein|nr:autotransporter-associated beta strand repeat-containing protein [Verrucomicrobiales bacterium]